MLNSRKALLSQNMKKSEYNVHSSKYTEKTVGQS